jgi:hypothetical protein
MISGWRYISNGVFKRKTDGHITGSVNDEASIVMAWFTSEITILPTRNRTYTPNAQAALAE